MKLRQYKHSASISLISLLIISAFTLILAIAMTQTNISTGYRSLNNNSDRIVYYYAESCIEESILRLESDSTFVSETVVFSPEASCVISVSGVGDRTIDISVTYLNYVQNFQGIVSLTQVGEVFNAKLLSWNKV